MTKARKTRGETIVEALVSMLIISLVFVFLVNAVVTSAHINASVKTEGALLELPSGTPTSEEATVTLKDSLASPSLTETAKVDLCTISEEGGDDYSYYEPKTTPSA